MGDSYSNAVQCDAATILLRPHQALPLDGCGSAARASRAKQRQRRSHIFAATRQLLSQAGCEELTVRQISRVSGCALQTVYNLVGPRNQAISAALSEYTAFIGRAAAERNPNPSMLDIVDTWLVAAEACPEYTRQCNLMFFTPSRHIYYQFREAEIRALANHLRDQQRCGVSFEMPPRQLAEQVIYFASAVLTEWADRPFPIAELRQKLTAGVSSLLRN